MNSAGECRWHRKESVKLKTDRKITQSERERENRLKKNEQSFRNLQDYNTRYNISCHLNFRKNGESRAEHILITNGWNFSNLEKDINLYI